MESEDKREFVCEKGKHCVGKPIIKLDYSKIVGAIIAIPYLITLSFICASVIIGPILLVIAHGLIGCIALALAWVKERSIFCSKWVLWRIKRWRWFSKKRI